MPDTLTVEQIRKLENEPKITNTPILESYVAVLKEAISLQAKMKPEEKRVLEQMLIATADTNNSALSNTEEYLSVRDVSKLLEISPQMVRRHCHNQNIIAWRTLDDTGEWRIDINQYKNNPRYSSRLAVILHEKQNREKNKANLIKTVRELSEMEGYAEMFDEINARRDKSRDND
ncbi:hypothetical protein ACTHQ0_28995 [Priestia megaterium]|uniref:hypothetical protein n=1 Tax=Priestia megaterium TaxID=1404 RepID=UPI003F7D93D4